MSPLSPKRGAEREQNPKKERRKRVKRKILLAIAFFAGLLIVWSLSNGFAYAVSGFDMMEFAPKFFKDVAEIDVEGYYIFVCSDTYISGELIIKNDRFNVFIELRNGKVWFYALGKLYGVLEGNLTVYDCLAIASRRLRLYQKFFDALYCDRFVEMLSAAIKAKNLTVEDEDFSLDISYRENCSTRLDYERYVMLHYIPKLNGYTLPGGGFVMSISKNGLLTFLCDASMDYVATTEVNVTEEQAINLALPYAEAYAREHGQRIIEVNATFGFARDTDCVRGDILAMYPRWSVWITFDKINEENVFAYAVLIWADNGEAYYHCPQGDYGPPPKGSLSANPLWLLAAATVAVVILFPVLGTYAHAKHKARKRDGNK